MALDEVTEAKVPFIGEDVDLFSTQAVFFLISLVLGMTVWNLSDNVGETLASRVAQYIGNLTGTNPATGNAAGGGAAFGGGA